MRLSKALLAGLLSLALLGAACSDGSSDVDAGDDSDQGSGDDGGADPAPDGSDVQVPDREPDLFGTITSVTPFEPVTEDCVPADEADPDGTASSDDPPLCTPADNDVIGTILVEGDLDPERGRKISYTVTTDTKITGETADGTGVGVYADLAEGQTVDSWATGPCAQSFPEQCTLEAIRVVG